MGLRRLHRRRRGRPVQRRPPEPGGDARRATSTPASTAATIDAALVRRPTSLGEFVGAFIGAFLVFLHYYPHWAETEDQGLKLAVFCTAPTIRNTVFNFISEVIGTFVLMFVIFAFGNSGDAMGLASLGALPVALLVLVIGLSLGGTTGYAINPARDLGPRIMHAILPIAGKGGSDWGYSWIPVVGPLIGGVIAALVYQLRLPQHGRPGLIACRSSA